MKASGRLLFVNKKKQKNFLHLLPRRRVECALAFHHFTSQHSIIAPGPIGQSFFASFCSQKDDSSCASGPPP